LASNALIDDFTNPQAASNGQHWRFFSDQVMGGVSTGQAQYDEVLGVRALRLTGEVSLANNGGFVQIALDLAEDGTSLDASAFSGIAIRLRGDGGACAVNLRTEALTRPWQSYRHTLQTTCEWQTYTCPFGAFQPHRTDRPLDPAGLRRIGVIAIGEARPVDIAVADLRFYACDA